MWDGCCIPADPFFRTPAVSHRVLPYAGIIRIKYRVRNFPFLSQLQLPRTIEYSISSKYTQNTRGLQVPASFLLRKYSLSANNTELLVNSPQKHIIRSGTYF